MAPSFPPGSVLAFCTSGDMCPPVNSGFLQAGLLLGQVGASSLLWAGEDGSQQRPVVKSSSLNVFPGAARTMPHRRVVSQFWVWAGPCAL